MLSMLPQAAAPKPQRTSRINFDKNLNKPQLLFDHVPKNNETGPFKPLLLNKPHASVALETAPISSDSDSQEMYAFHISTYSQHGPLAHQHQLKHLLPKPSTARKRYPNIDPNSPSRYPHPYQLEIEQYRYPSTLYTQSEPIPYHPFETTTAIFVDTEEALNEMLEELKQAKEIAIDLEHHDQHTYVGIVSLMQISTRDKDWIVDTLKPWRRKLSILNEVFADPGIIKVLHGAFMDAVWLQRDLGLYLVGLFDTHHASRALGYTGGSLAFLLKKFANVDAQKQYQMADWRVRPLPKELFDYARSDTHYLLYIFDCMRNELIERSDFGMPDHEGDKLWDVLQKSSEVALQRYEHPQYDAELGQGSSGWYRLLSRTPALFSKEQFSVFRAVHQWRDTVARQQDESLHWVMPNHQVFSLAKAMPPTRLALLGVAQPNTQTVRLRADELLSVITKAKAAGQNGPDMMEVLEKVEPQYRKPAAALTAAPTTTTQPTAPIANGFTASAMPIRTPTSAFWGAAFESSAWDQRRNATTASSVSLTVPIPPLTAEIFADPPEITESPTQPEPSPDVAPEPMEEDEQENTFILKEVGKKRKRAEPVDGMAAQMDEVIIPVDNGHAEKQARKAAKKAAKLAAKREAAGEEGEEEEAPFDYAAAPSILNPPREKLTAKERRGKNRQINPYAKSLDSAKGMPRTQKEKPGKSMTFRK